MSGGGLPASAGARAWVPQAAALLASLVAVRAAFASVVPGHAANPAVALVVAGLLWLGTLVAASAWEVSAAGIVAAQHEWTCVALIAGGGAPLMIVLAATTATRRPASARHHRGARRAGGRNVRQRRRLLVVTARQQRDHAAWHGGAVRSTRGRWRVGRPALLQMAGDPGRRGCRLEARPERCKPPCAPSSPQSVAGSARPLAVATEGLRPRPSRLAAAVLRQQRLLQADDHQQDDHGKRQADRDRRRLQRDEPAAREQDGRDDALPRATSRSAAPRVDRATRRR